MRKEGGGKPTVAIIGVGLIGGSLGMALRRSRKYRVWGIGRHRKQLQRARRLGAVDRFSTKLQDVRHADIVVVGVPVDHEIPVIREMLPYLKPQAVVTDVGSVKQSILLGVARLKTQTPFHFIGGHPLAGSHRTGVAAARSDLFKGATCVLVRQGRAPLAAVRRLWKTAGARTMVLSAEDHDRAVALISHLPHVLAHALVRMVMDHPDRRTLTPLLAGSFRDVTRVASSDPEQWAQILRANAAAVRAALAEFKSELYRLQNSLGRSRLKPILQRSHAFRRSLFHGI